MISELTHNRDSMLLRSHKTAKNDGRKLSANRVLLKNKRNA